MNQGSKISNQPGTIEVSNATYNVGNQDHKGNNSVIHRNTYDPEHKNRGSGYGSNTITGIIFFVDETEPVEIPQFAVPSEYRVQYKNVSGTENQVRTMRQEGSADKPNDFLPTMYQFHGLSQIKNNREVEVIGAELHQNIEDASQNQEMATTNEFPNNGEWYSDQTTSPNRVQIPAQDERRVVINNSDVVEGHAVAINYVIQDGSTDILKTAHYLLGTHCYISGHNCDIIDSADINIRGYTQGLQSTKDTMK